MYNVRHEAFETNELPAYYGPLVPGNTADGLDDGVRELYETYRVGTVFGNSDGDVIRGYTIQTGDADEGQEVTVHAFVSHEQLEKVEPAPEGSEYGDEDDIAWYERGIRTVGIFVAKTLHRRNRLAAMNPDPRAEQ